MIQILFIWFVSRIMTQYETNVPLPYDEWHAVRESAFIYDNASLS